jgi:hypothetical protein
MPIRPGLDSTAIGGNIDPLIRDYIEARLGELLAEVLPQIQSSLEEIKWLRQQSKDVQLETQARLSSMENTINTNQDHRITKLKIIELMKAMGLE